MTTTTEDILAIADAEGTDLAAMSRGSHYHYRRQVWIAGHDHAHFTTDDGPLSFCGADQETCQGRS